MPGESREILDLDTASAKIPAYAQLSAIIRNRDADLLVCQDLSRLGREASLIIQIVRLCQRNQIALYARSSPPSTLDARKQETDIAASLMLALESAMVRVEMINLRKRHDIGTRGRAKRGLFASKIPYGYFRTFAEDGKTETYHVNHEQADALRYIFTQYLNGDGLETIAANLTRLGIPRPDGQTQWGKQSVRLLIWNVDRYAGWAEINKRGDREYVRARGIWQPIIDEATAESVHAEYQKRHAYRRGHSVNDYLYRGILICTSCATTMRAHTQTTRKGTIIADYVCRNSDCTSRNYITENNVTPVLIAEIKRLSTQTTIDTIQPATHRVALPIASALESARTAHAETDNERARLIAAFSKGIITEDDTEDDLETALYNLQYARLDLQTRITDLENQIAEAEHRSASVARLRTVADVGLQMLRGDKTAANQWLSKYLRIWIEDNKVLLFQYL